MKNVSAGDLRLQIDETGNTDAFIHTINSSGNHSFWCISMSSKTLPDRFSMSGLYRMGPFIHGVSCDYKGWLDLSDYYLTGYQLTNKDEIAKHYSDI